MTTELVIIDNNVNEALLPPEKYDTSLLREEVVKEALWAAQGNLTKAAKYMNLPYSMLYHYVNKNEILKGYIKTVQSLRNNLRCDILEDLAFNQALLGDSSLIWKLLCTYGKEKGYGDTTKVNLTASISPQLTSLLASLKDLRDVTSDNQSETEKSFTVCNKEN